MALQLAGQRPIDGIVLEGMVTNLEDALPGIKRLLPSSVHRLVHRRIGEDLLRYETPVETIRKISVPLLMIRGKTDQLFPMDQTQKMYKKCIAVHRSGKKIGVRFQALTGCVVRPAGSDIVGPILNNRQKKTGVLAESLAVRLGLQSGYCSMKGNMGSGFVSAVVWVTFLCAHGVPGVRSALHGENTTGKTRRKVGFSGSWMYSIAMVNSACYFGLPCLKPPARFHLCLIRTCGVDHQKESVDAQGTGNRKTTEHLPQYRKTI